MLYPVAGTRVFIGGPVNETDRPWIEIGEVEAIGTVGVQWQTQETVIYDCEEIRTVEIDKTARSASSFQIVMGADGADPGQIMLWEAAASVWGYWFRFVLPSGDIRIFGASVTALGEVFDSANTVIKLQADLLPAATSYQRSEAL